MTNTNSRTKSKLRPPHSVRQRKGETYQQAAARWRLRWAEYVDAILMHQLHQLRPYPARRRHFAAAFWGVQAKWMQPEDFAAARWSPNTNS